MRNAKQGNDRNNGNLVPRVSYLTAPRGGKMKDPGKEVVTIGHSALGCQFNSGEPRAGKTWVRKTKSKNCFSPLKDSSQLVGPYLPLQIKLLWL